MPVKMMRRMTAAAAPRIMPHMPLARLQAAAGQRDHQGIVARQQHVDPDDLADRNPERRLVHLALKLGENPADRRRIDGLPYPVHRAIR